MTSNLGNLGWTPPDTGTGTGNIKSDDAANAASTGGNLATKLSLTSSQYISSITESSAAVKLVQVDPGKPFLSPSNLNDPAFSQETIKYLFNTTAQFNHFSKMIDNKLKNTQDGLTSNSLTTEPPVTTTTITDPQIIALAAQNNITPEQMLKNIENEANSTFNAEVDDQVSQGKMTKSEADQIKFAVSTGTTDSLPADLKAKLQSITTTINQSLQQQFGLSSDWKTPALIPQDTVEAFKDNLSGKYDQAFISLLNAAKTANGLTEDQYNTLMTMHYMPDEVAQPADPQLLALLKTLNGEAAAQLGTQYNFDPTKFALAPSTAFFTSVVNGAYVVAFNKAIKDYTPPLTDTQKEQIEKFFENPDDPSIPESIKQLVATLKATVLPSVIAKYGLSSTWQPDVASLDASGIDPKILSALQAAYDQFKEKIAIITTMLDNMPEGPEKMLFLAYLQLIGAQLDKLQQAIYALQSGESKISKMMASLQLATSIDDIQTQQNAIDEAKAKEKKMASMGKWVSAIADFFILAGGLLFAPVTGGASLAAALFYVIDSAVSIANGGTSLMQDMFKAVHDACPSDRGGGCGEFLAYMTLSVLLSGGNPMLGMQLFFTDANAIVQVADTSGDDTTDAAYASASIQAIIMIIMAAVMIVFTLGATAPAAISAVVMKIAQTASLVVSVVMAAFSIAQDGMAINNAYQQSQIDILKGKTDAYVEKLEGLIDILKKLIKKLLELLQGNSDFIVDISNFQGQKWSDAGAISSAIFSSGAS